MSTKLVIKALRSLFNKPVKRRTAIKLGAAAAATGAAGPILKYTTPPAKQAFNRAYRKYLKRTENVQVKGEGGHWGGYVSQNVQRKEVHPQEFGFYKNIRRERFKSALEKRPMRNYEEIDHIAPHSPVHIRAARSSQASELRRIRSLRRLGKESKTVTRRSLLTPKKKRTR